jgi:chemotaxis protein methyltransferase CheR
VFAAGERSVKQLEHACSPVDNRDCTGFLQWALAQRDFRWPGFRKVRRQVCKRLNRRIRELGLADFAAYRRRLEADAAEWTAFDNCCAITISRFYRDRSVYETLRERVLAEIAARAVREGRMARIWSAGCASGEEPYTLKVTWDYDVARSFPDASVSIVATDIDETALARARRGCFESTSLRELPPDLVEHAFNRVGPLYCVKPKHRAGIEFLHQDLRRDGPAITFDLVLCRNIAFTYFAEPLQRHVLRSIMDRLASHGYLVIGTHERLPSIGPMLRPLCGAPQIFEPTEVAEL